MRLCGLLSLTSILVTNLIFSTSAEKGLIGNKNGLSARRVEFIHHPKVVLATDDSVKRYYGKIKRRATNGVSSGHPKKSANPGKVSRPGSGHSSNDDDDDDEPDDEVTGSRPGKPAIPGRPRPPAGPRKTGK